MSNIAQMIKTIAGNSGEVEARVCVVTAVDVDARTVDCEPLDESAPILGVNLQANQGLTTGIVTFPQKGSHVIVAMMNSGMGGCVIATEEIERAEIVIGETSAELTKDGIVLNGGEFGGLVKVEELTERINNIEEDINSLKDIFAVWKVIPQDGGAALNAASIDWAMSKLTLTKRGDYENEKVKQ